MLKRPREDKEPLGAVGTLMPRRGRRRRKLPWLTFLLGLSLGYGLAKPAAFAQLSASLGEGAVLLQPLFDRLGVGRRQVLVLGTDKVGDNTDVMFSVRVQDGVTRIVQLPRDTYITSGRLGVVKANALYSQAGIAETKLEMGRLLGVPIDRYIKVNLDAVARVGDALGEVAVDVPKRMVYVDRSQNLNTAYLRVEGQESGSSLLRRMLGQHLLEIPARVTGGMLGNLFWSSRHHDLAALVAPFGAQINQPVSAANHIKVVLNHQD